MTKRLRPGNKAKKSGQYEERGPHGGDVRGPEVTVVKGEPLPPTTKSGNTYALVDPSDNRSGRRRR